jgi:hypothetical protein
MATRQRDRYAERCGQHHPVGGVDGESLHDTGDDPERDDDEGTGGEKPGEEGEVSVETLDPDDARERERETEDVREPCDGSDDVDEYHRHPAGEHGTDGEGPDDASTEPGGCRVGSAEIRADGSGGEDERKEEGEMPAGIGRQRLNGVVGDVHEENRQRDDTEEGRREQQVPEDGADRPTDPTEPLHTFGRHLSTPPGSAGR